MVSVPDPAPFGIAYAMLGPLVSEGAVVSAGAVQALRTQCLVPSVSEGGVVSETFMQTWTKEPFMHCLRNACPPVSEGLVVSEMFMQTWTKCPCSQAGASACSVL